MPKFVDIGKYVVESFNDLTISARRSYPGSERAAGLKVSERRDDHVGMSIKVRNVSSTHLMQQIPAGKLAPANRHNYLRPTPGPRSAPKQ